MDNRKQKQNNYVKFRHAAMCGCQACIHARVTTTVQTVKCDFFNPEDYKDDDGWF